jgi:hypothetical protein
MLHIGMCSRQQLSWQDTAACQLRIAGMQTASCTTALRMNACLSLQRGLTRFGQSQPKLRYDAGTEECKKLVQPVTVTSATVSLTKCSAAEAVVVFLSSVLASSSQQRHRATRQQ